MKVTNEWLEKWATENGGYTKRQLAVVGVSWPPEKGWKAQVIGIEISDDEARNFESLAGRPNDHR